MDRPLTKEILRRGGPHGIQEAQGVVQGHKEARRLQEGSRVKRGYRGTKVGVLLKGALLLVTITIELAISLCVTQYVHLLTSIQ